ncbi:DUF308 domain-containing protein [Tissierella carlieri]|uniref:HdeD family acid-resistance protein n=1 Tax=Tissierella carlieri TaxID=689904 RepID=UPI001C0FBBD9|nr:DUF308 domain-containing protein [Tissierella carlieri]MBU5312695.1 DUF308 domain-containing protein [Tissierella carlieri]MDU5081938.1 DUF308 domain-containing protein [Bacillota bacterium]
MDIKYLKIKDIDVFSMVFSGLLYLGLGIIFLTQKNILMFAVRSLLNLLVILFAIIAMFQLMGFTPLRKKRLTAISRLFGFVVNLVMALIIYFIPEEVVSVLPIAFGIYAFFSGVVRFLIYLQYRKNKVSRRFFILVGAIVLTFFGIMMVTKPLAYLVPLSNLIGTFFLFYGFTFLMDGLLEGLPLETKNSFKRRFRISLPVFMVALIPHKILMEINKAFETEELSQKDLVYFKENTPCDLEVFIHVAEKGTYAFGHVDIWFEGKIMTYGCYDESTFKLGGLISDGVLVEIEDKEKYIAFSQSHLGKTLFGFGLKLTKEQKIRVREKIEEIHENLYEWKPKSRIDEEMGIRPEKPYKDYSSILYENLKGKFYKFIKGPFKTYFAMNTNCVLLADTIVGQAGIDLVKIQGLISPGAYFEYFNREFLRKNSFVVSRTIYYDLEGQRRRKLSGRKW